MFQHALIRLSSNGPIHHGTLVTYLGHLDKAGYAPPECGVKLLPGNGAVGVVAAVVRSCGMNGGAQTDHGDPDFYAPNHPFYVVCIPGLSDSHCCVTVLVCSQQCKWTLSL